jgi:hypothetical protein
LLIHRGNRPWVRGGTFPIPDKSGVGDKRTQVLTSPRSASRLCHDVVDEETNGGRAGAAVADSRGVDAGGLLFSLINPEIAAGHPNYARNYHLLSLVNNMSFLASAGVVGILWLLVCFLVIRSKERSWL